MRVFKKVLLVSVGLVCMSLGQVSGLTLNGSTTVLPIAQSCAEEFSDMYPSIKISVMGGGSSVGISSLIDGTTDIANSSRPIKTKEIKQARMKGVQPVANVVALDGITVIVNPSNDISKITTKELKDIFTGKVSNWQELGFKKEKIVVVSRDSTSGTFESFNEFVLKGNKVSPEALMEASNQAVINVVSKTGGAIGYVGIGYVQEGVKALTVDGVNATKETVKSKKYPLSRPLFMYTNGKPSGDAKKFIDFVLSERGQKIVEDQGFVSVK